MVQILDHEAVELLEGNLLPNGFSTAVHTRVLVVLLHGTQCSTPSSYTTEEETLDYGTYCRMGSVLQCTRECCYTVPSVVHQVVTPRRKRHLIMELGGPISMISWFEKCLENPNIPEHCAQAKYNVL